jgi:hypothetical protein
MKQKPAGHLLGTKDWSPGSSLKPVEYGRGMHVPISRKSATLKTVVAVAIVGVVALAILQETGIIKLFSWK